MRSAERSVVLVQSGKTSRIAGRKTSGGRLFCADRSEAETAKRGAIRSFSTSAKTVWDAPRYEHEAICEAK